MNLRELALAVRDQGVRLTVAPDGGLRVRGNLTPELRAALIAHKPEVLARLSTGDPVLDMVCDVFDCDLRRIERRLLTPFDTPAAREVR